jgi:hypothetical protein
MFIYLKKEKKKDTQCLDTWTTPSPPLAPEGRTLVVLTHRSRAPLLRVYVRLLMVR